MKQTVLLTGATGFLGSHLLAALLKNQYKVVILKRSFSNIDRIANIIHYTKYYDIDKVLLNEPFEENKIDIIIHTATNYGRQDENFFDIVDSNYIFPLKLLELASQFKTQYFINTDTFLNKYLNIYSLSKKQFYECFVFYSKKVDIINIKAEHLYGPLDDDSRFVMWIIRQFASNVPRINLTHGEQHRDFIYIEDAVDAFIKIVNNRKNLGQQGDFYLGTGKTLPIRDFVLIVKNLISDVCGTSVETVCNFGAIPYREGEIMKIDDKPSALLELGWRPAHDLDSGLRKTIEWYHNKYSKSSPAKSAM